ARLANIANDFPFLRLDQTNVRRLAHRRVVVFRLALTRRGPQRRQTSDKEQEGRPPEAGRTMPDALQNAEAHHRSPATLGASRGPVRREPALAASAAGISVATFVPSSP